MRVGLLNLEPDYVNSAMMQVSMYHRLNDDFPEPYFPLWRRDYGKIYAFSIFDFTDKGQVPPEAIRGGTGFNVLSRLPPEIEACDYDYEIFPECDFSIVWFSRGCSRNCGFCIVPRKEGRISSVAPKPLNPAGRHVRVMDNNFFAAPEWREAVRQLEGWNQPVDFHQGVDVRILDEEMAGVLNRLKHLDQSCWIKIAWDDPREDLVPQLKKVTGWIKPYKLMCYVLIGYNSSPAEDLARVEALRALKIEPFVMKYDPRDRYQVDFARWVNHKAIFKTVRWHDYRKAGGVRR